MARTKIDIFHAYATKVPLGAFKKQRFAVCSGMSWWRGGSPGSVHMAQIMHEKCGIMCDDQKVLNQLLIDRKAVGMTWEWPDHVLSSRLVDLVDKRYDGLLTRGMIGRSNVTQHVAKLWDRDFAFRGPLELDSNETSTTSSGTVQGADSLSSSSSSSKYLSCPIGNHTSRDNNWVAMPIVHVRSRAESIQAKIKSFQQWDKLCGIDLDGTQQDVII